METIATVSPGKQKYDVDFLQSIVDRYPIAGEIKEYRRFELGFEDTNYFVEVEDHWYVIKIFETADTPLGSTEFKVEVMDATYQAGLKTPKVYRNALGSLMTRIDGKQVILMDFVGGEHMARGEFRDELVYEIGQQTGRMDTVLADIDGGERVSRDFSLDLRNFLNKETNVDVLPTDFDRSVFREVFDTFRRIKSSYDALPSGIIHHDIVAHNIIAADGRLAAIIDFSDVIHAPYAQNVATTLCQTVFWYNWHPEQAGKFLKGYREFHSFTEDEAALLYDLTLARYAILIINLNNKNLRYGNDARRTSYMEDRYWYLKRLLDFGRNRFDAALTVND